MLLSLLSLILILATRASKADFVMILVNGSPEEFSNYTIVTYYDFPKCLTYCSTYIQCVGAYNNGSDSTCILFNGQQLKSIKRDGYGYKIAYKISNTDLTTCPVDDTEGGKGYLSIYNGTQPGYISYVVNYDENEETWNIDYSQPLYCPPIFYRLFVRAAGPWCMRGLSTNSPLMNRNEAASSNARWNLTLTGIDNEIEYQYIEGKAKSSSYSNLSCCNPPLSGFWIDGVRKPECIGNPACQGLSAFQFSDPTFSLDPTGYKWNPNQPGVSNTQDCLIYQINADGTGGIATAPCNSTISTDGQTSFRGQVLGTRPSP